MKKTLFLILILIISALQTHSQNFLNLNFEYDVYKHQPRKWVIEGEGEYFSAKVENGSAAHAGEKGLVVKLKNAEVYIFLSLPGSLVKGNLIHVSGHIKSDNFDSLQVLLAYRDPQGGKPVVSPLQDPKNNEWIPIENQTAISTEYKSDRLLTALILIGTGKIYFDDVAVKINGLEIGNSPPDFSEPSEADISLVNTDAIPIKSYESTSGLSDLEKLDAITGKSRVVALGENSHGSATIYKLKLRLLQFLIQRKGFDIFALECPSVEADVINNYVLKNEGTITDVLNSLIYPSWKTQEMIDIIEWIKAYNQKAKTKVQFIGFDMQDGKEALRQILELDKVSNGTLSSTLAIVNTAYLEAKKSNNWRTCYDEITKLENVLKSNRSRLLDSDSTKLNRDILVLKQSIGFKLGFKSRDEYMAENIQWILNHNRNARMIISADNSHITRATGKMGQFLDKRYGDDYLNFGFTLNKGTYAAYGSNQYYEVHPSYAGTYEYLFSKCKYRDFFLDIREDKMKAILQSPKGFRSIGSRPQETTQFSEISLPQHFDIIVYSENSRHTMMR